MATTVFTFRIPLRDACGGPIGAPAGVAACAGIGRTGLATLIYFTLNMSLILLMRLVERKVAVPGLISVGGK